MKHIKTMFIVITVILLICFCAYSYIRKKPNSINDWENHIIAHRGASGEEPEHTYAAYDLAIEYGIKYIEQDCVFSKDGTLFVSHDLDVEYDGEIKAISDLTDEELISIGILKLEDVFLTYEDSDVNFVVELRPDFRDSYNGLSQAQCFIDLLSSMGTMNYCERIIVQCWELNTAQIVKSYSDSIRTMYLISLQDEESIMSVCLSDNIDMICLPYPFLSELYISEIHSSGKLCGVYTVNRAEEIRNAIVNGVDFYFTDFVARAIVLECKYRH